MPPGPHFSSSYNHHLSKKTEVMITKKRLVYSLVLILTSMSVFRLLRLAVTTFPYSPVPSLFPPLRRYCNPLDPPCHNFSNETISSPISTLTIKELKFLTDLVSQKSPCNLLIFGVEPEYFSLSKINSEGTTIMLEDSSEKLMLFHRRSKSSNNTRIHKVDYTIPAKDAYKVLKKVRKKAICSPSSRPLGSSNCRLGLTSLPEEVYRKKWGVIIVDGPSGDRPDSPGRMAAIYTASVLARAGNGTNVVVHDVDRLIERWFSWEFLCEDNLVSSKGKFWNFFVEGDSGTQSNSKGFCFLKSGPNS